MTDREIAVRIIENDFERQIYQGCLHTEQSKVNWKNRGAAHNTDALVEARAFDMARTSLRRMLERAA